MNLFFFNHTVTSPTNQITTFWLISHSNLHSKLSNHFIESQIPPPAIFKIPKFTPFHPFLKLACQKLHTFISSNWIKNCPFFATTSPFFHLSTPIIAQFKALNLPFHCIPHFCYPQFFSPIATPIWFFSTTLLLVPPSKSQFFYAYLNQFFTLNSQIIFIQSQRPLCPFPIP